MHSMALHCMSASRAEQGARSMHSMHSMALHCISASRAEQGAESMHTGDHAAWQGGSQGAGEEGGGRAACILGLMLHGAAAVCPPFLGNAALPCLLPVSQHHAKAVVDIKGGVLIVVTDARSRHALLAGKVAVQERILCQHSLC